MLKKPKWVIKEARLRIKYMTNKDCIFCKLINREMTPKFLWEDDMVVAFDDINPASDTHVLIVPKKHIPSATEVKEADASYLVAMHKVAAKLVKDLNLDAYRLAYNGGRFQHVEHMHMHLLAGKKIEWKKL